MVKKRVAAFTILVKNLFTIFKVSHSFFIIITLKRIEFGTKKQLLDRSSIQWTRAKHKKTTYQGRCVVPQGGTQHHQLRSSPSHGPSIPCGPTCKTNKKRCRGKPSHPLSPLRLALATALSIKMRAARAQWVLLLMLSRSDTRDSGPTCIRLICLAGLHSSL